MFLLHEADALFYLMLIKNQSAFWVSPSAKHIGLGSAPGILIKYMFSFPLLLKVRMKHEENDTQTFMVCEGFEMFSQFFISFSLLSFRQLYCVISYIWILGETGSWSLMTIGIACMDV